MNNCKCTEPTDRDHPRALTPEQINVMNLDLIQQGKDFLCLCNHRAEFYLPKGKKWALITCPSCNGIYMDAVTIIDKPTGWMVDINE